MQVRPGMVLIVFAALACQSCLGPPCDSRLTVRNGSDMRIADFGIHPAGTDFPPVPVAIPAFGSEVFHFPEFAEGSYTFHLTLPSGNRILDSIGYLDPRLSFLDTLTLFPEGSDKPYLLKQGIGTCAQKPHIRSIIRRALKELLR